MRRSIVKASMSGNRRRFAAPAIAAGILIVVVLALANYAGAAAVLLEGFQYVDGNLAGNGGVGYGGASWDTAWSGDTSEFQVVSEKVRSGYSGAPPRTVQRQFTSTVAPGTTMYFSTVMNQIGNEGGYEFDWGFTNPNVGLAMYNDEWRLKLGGSTQTTSGAAVPDATDFRVVGRLEFNVAGTDDWLTMWVDPASESAAHLMQITTDCGLDTLGNEFRLRRLGGCDSSKQWDDVRIGTDFGSVIPATPTLLLEDNFAYADGDLQGQNGGSSDGGASWDTAWSDDLHGTLTKEFQVSSERVRMTQSGSPAREIKREFTAGVDPGTTMYFSTLLTKVGGEGDYNFDYRFPGIGASLGIDSTHTGGDQFSLALGSQSAKTTGTGTVVQDEPYRVVGRLEFDAVGNQERLTMWANPAFESDDPVLQLAEDRGMDTLGDLVSLYYGVRADGAKQWDDLRIATEFEEATRLRVDIGPNGQALEPGFEAWNVGTVGGENVVVPDRDFTQFGGFTARLERDGSGGIDIRDRGSAGGLLDDLKRDGVKENGLRLIFDGLEYGLYELTSYHHDRLDTAGGGMYQIYIGDATDPVAILGQTGGGASPASATFTFMPSQSGETYFRFIHGEAWLNGFQLAAIHAIPEPSTCLLLALGALCLVACRRRRK